MHLLRALTLSALTALLYGCPGGDPDPTPDAGAPDAGAPDAGAPDAGLPDAGPPDAGAPDAGPVLSEVPRWQVDHDPSYEAGCFGRSVALGDVNGDGRKDLVVGASPCLSGTRDMGRVSLFAGEAPYFSKQAHTTVMNWRNTSTRTNGNQLAVATGNVNGDAYADVLVSGQYGALVFKGGPDLGTVISAEPLFQAPTGSGVYGNAVLVDVTGDGLDDLLSLRGGVLSVYRANTAPEGGPFVLVPRTHALLAISVSARGVGDVNGDGVRDVVTSNSGVYHLYLGCKADSGLVCDGALTAQPVWSLASETMALFPDLSGDGRPERFVSPGGGSLMLHLSDAQAQGGFSATPVWSVMADPVFGLGSPVSVGDLDGDGLRNDFVMSGMGRLYLFSPGQAVSTGLKPAWAWPRADSLPDGYEGFRRYTVAVAGDLEGDGFDDLVVGISPLTGLSSEPGGRVVVFGGGRVPAEPVARPYLPEVRECGLALDPENGKPDLGVDADVLARTLYVERRTFAADACEVTERCVGGTGERRLLRFSTSIVNMGTAAATVPNSDERPELYEFDACHRHEHLTGFAGYALRDGQGQDVVVGRKQGFYLVDYHRQCPDAAPYFEWSMQMGISPGWADIYVADIPCQWIDVTGVPDGTYTLRVGVDEQNIIDELDGVSNEATLRVRLEGDTATVLP